MRMTTIPIRTPVLDHAYLLRLGFLRHEEGYFSRHIRDIEIRVFDTGEGILNDARIPVKFISVTHLKWFMDAFK